MTTIQSKLAKTAALVMHSTWFPLLVEAACWVEGVPYDKSMLKSAAMNAQFLNSLVWDDATDIDTALKNALGNANAATQIDNYLRNAVAPS